MSPLSFTWVKRWWRPLLLVVAGTGLILCWWLSPYLRGLLVHHRSEDPFVVEFGRGSGRHGLDTIKVFANGTVVLHRVSADGTQAASLTLSPAALTELRAMMDRHGLLRLHRHYDGKSWDGTQWVLRIPEGQGEHAVYFDNLFPPEIEQFAGELDRLLTGSGMNEASWARVAYFSGHGHERGLWASIRGRPAGK